jgi:flagellar biosynthetic protein FliS
MIVMLYDGALARIGGAAAAAYRRDYETQFNESLQAVRILNGLACCLDMRNGGSVAVSLREMYQAMTTVLLAAVAKRDGGDICHRTASALRLTRNAWADIAKLPRLPDPLTITRIDGDSDGEAVAATTGNPVFTEISQSDIYTLRRGEPGKRVRSNNSSNIEQQADVILGIPGSLAAIRRRSGDLA